MLTTLKTLWTATGVKTRVLFIGGLLAFGAIGVGVLKYRALETKLTSAQQQAMIAQANALALQDTVTHTLKSQLDSASTFWFRSQLQHALDAKTLETANAALADALKRNGVQARAIDSLQLQIGSTHADTSTVGFVHNDARNFDVKLTNGTVLGTISGMVPFDTTKAIELHYDLHPAPISMLVITGCKTQAGVRIPVVTVQTADSVQLDIQRGVADSTMCQESRQTPETTVQSLWRLKIWLLGASALGWLLHH